MRICLFYLSCLLLSTCNKSDISTLAPTPGTILGTWELTEVYFDIGNGSGEFTPADNSRSISFFADSTYTTDLGICTISDVTGAGRGSYSPGKAQIAPTSCRIGADYEYEVDGLRLTIYYWCIEGCAERYTKIRD